MDSGTPLTNTFLETQVKGVTFWSLLGVWLEYE